jgi:membrane protein DedA with SNARE-associated domain
MGVALQDLLTANAWVVYLAVALVVFAEDALFIGFLIPGETAAVIGGVAASLGHVHLATMVAVVIAAAIVGDSVGYEVGRRVGPRLLATRRMARHLHRVEWAREFLLHHGGKSVFLARFAAFLRAMMPAMAGMMQMPYRRFILWNAIGGVIWGTLFSVLGFVSGSSYASMERNAARDIAFAIAGLIVFLLARYLLRRRAG